MFSWLTWKKKSDSWHYKTTIKFNLYWILKNPAPVPFRLPNVIIQRAIHSLTFLHTPAPHSSAPHTLKASLMQERTKRSPCNAFHSAKDTAICITSSRAFWNPALTGFLKKHLWKINRAAAYYAIDKDVIAVTCYAKLGGLSKNSSYSEWYEPSFQPACSSRLISQGWDGKTGIVHQRDERRMKARNTPRSPISCNTFSSARIRMCPYRLSFLLHGLFAATWIYESFLIFLPGFNQCWLWWWSSDRKYQIIIFENIFTIHHHVM